MPHRILRSRGQCSRAVRTELQAGGIDEADVIENTRRCQAAVERAIRQHPEQWLWIHRRWKTRPPEEKGTRIY